MLLFLLVAVNGFVDVPSKSAPLSSSPFVVGRRNPTKKTMTPLLSIESSQICNCLYMTNVDVADDDVSEEESTVNPKAKSLKEELFQLASATKRGFSASQEERKKARSIIYNLAKYNPTKEPAFSYYPSTSSTQPPLSTTSLSGKWTLIYTDAPDITSLDPSLSSSPSPPSLIPPTAKLGRIGQECNPPYIKNVIEWNKPDWIPDFIPSPSSTNTVLQKVVCQASATPSNPKVVDLKLVGFDIQIPEDERNGSSSSTTTAASFLDNLRDLNPFSSSSTSNELEIRGVITVPFGTFEILYLDEEIRIIKTGQNYLAVNVRLGTKEEEWF